MSAILSPVITSGAEAHRHPDGPLHAKGACLPCALEQGVTFMARCYGECGAVTPHEVTGATSGECLRCGTARWV